MTFVELFKLLAGLFMIGIFPLIIALVIYEEEKKLNNFAKFCIWIFLLCLGFGIIAIMMFGINLVLTVFNN